MCQAKAIPFDSIFDDHELMAVRSVIRQRDRGVLAAMQIFGCGADIRLEVDSFVFIGFTQRHSDEFIQMTGRNSRSLGSHHSQLLTIDHLMSAEELRAKLACSRIRPMKDGLRVVNYMRGRREAGVDSDADLMPMLKLDWRINMRKFYAKVGPNSALEHETSGHCAMRRLQFGLARQGQKQPRSV